jgi:hypothetical protein
LVLEPRVSVSEFSKTERVLAEMLGIGLAAVFVVLGMVAKGAADNLDN